MGNEDYRDQLIVNDLYTDGFGMCSRKLMRDEKLIPGAKLLYAYMASHQGGCHTIYLDAAQRELQMPDDIFAKSRAELKTYLAQHGRPVNL